MSLLLLKYLKFQNFEPLFFHLILIKNLHKDIMEKIMSIFSSYSKIEDKRKLKEESEFFMHFK